MEHISKHIVDLAVGGDKEAFEKIYKASSTFVYTIALRVTNNQDDAEDVTQEVFIKVYKNLGTFRFHSSFKTWIYRIAANTAINICRGKSKEMGRRDEDIEDIEDISDMNQYAAQERETTSDDKDNEKHISSLLKILNPDQRACIVLREIEGLNYKEMAEVLKVKINTVRSRLKRAREKLLAYRKGKVDQYGM